MFFKLLINYLESLRLSDLIIVMTAFYIIYINNIKMINIQDIVLGRTNRSPLVLSFYKTIIGILGGLVVSYLANKKGLKFNSYIEIQMILFLTILSFIQYFWIIDISITAAIIIIYSLSINSNSLLNSDISNIYYLISFLLITEGFILILDRKILYLPIFKKDNNGVSGGYRVKDFYSIILLLTFVPGNKKYYMIYPILISFMFFNVNESIFTFSKNTGIILKGIFRIITGFILYGITELLNYEGNNILIVIVIFPILLNVEKYLFKQIENMRRSKFKSNKEYQTILDVRKNSPAYKLGLRSGDKIIEVNNQKSLSYIKTLNAIHGINKNKEIILRIINKYNIEKVISLEIDSKESSGIIIVPDEESVVIK